MLPRQIEISAASVAEYVGRYRAKLGEEAYKEACEEHALPENFEAMEYTDFLEKRRILMANIVKKAYKKLCE